MKIVLDLDDTLCSFCEPWGEWVYLEGISDRIVSLEEISSYSYFYETFGDRATHFYEHDPLKTYTHFQKPFEGSHEFLEWCQEMFDDVSICSHAESDEACEAKKWFVKKHFNFDNIVFSGRGKSKSYFTDKDSILIDDHPYNLIQHLHQHKAPVICFNKGNRNGWSNLVIHRKMLLKLKPDLTKYYRSDSYDYTKKILEQYV